MAVKMMYVAGVANFVGTVTGLALLAYAVMARRRDPEGTPPHRHLFNVETWPVWVPVLLFVWSVADVVGLVDRGEIGVAIAQLTLLPWLIAMVVLTARWRRRPEVGFRAGPDMRGPFDLPVINGDEWHLPE